MQDTPAGPIEAPVIIGQGAADTLVVPSAQEEYVQARCAGYAVEYRTYDGADHLQLVEPASPAVADSIAWTKERWAGAPAADTCG